MAKLRAIFKATLHAAAAGIMGFGFHSMQKLPIDRHISIQYGGHLQFLTIQGLALTWITMAISFFSDILPSFKGVRILKRYLAIIALPVSMVVSLIYWPLMILFPQLILPPASDSANAPEIPSFVRIPLWIDLSLHATPALSILVDFFFFESKYRWKDVQVGAPITTVAFGLGYSLWVEHCGKINGVFPYPFLTKNTFPVRVVIYSGATLLAFGSFIVINSFHRNR